MRCRLVGFHGEHVVGALGGDQGGTVTLGAHGIRWMITNPVMPIIPSRSRIAGISLDLALTATCPTTSPCRG